MSKRLITTVAACAVVLAVAGIAYGAAVKIKEFEIIGQTELSRDADAMAILNYAAGEDKTIVQIVLSAFVPDETYTYLVVSPSHTGLYSTPNGTFVTDKHGHATLHLSLLAPPVDPSSPPEDGNFTDSDIYIGIGVLQRNGNTVTGDVRAIGHHPVP